MPYPVGPAYQLLALAGLRLNEIMRAERSEFDLRARVWTIPKNRMKGRNGRARAHAVPLTPRMIAIIEALPSNGTNYLFTKGTKIESEVDQYIETMKRVRDTSAPDEAAARRVAKMMAARGTKKNRTGTVTIARRKSRQPAALPDE
jgi:integrase